MTVAQSPSDPQPNQNVTFTASATDEGQVTSYAWDLTGDGGFHDASGPTASRSFSADGTYDVAVRVTDDANQVTTQHLTVTVKTRPPSMTLTASNPSPYVHQKTTVTAAVDDNATVQDADIHWGLEACQNGRDDGYGLHSGRSWDVSFGAPSCTIVKARATDSQGRTFSARTTITVPNRGPTFREIRVRARKVPDNPFNKDPLVKGQPVILQAVYGDDNVQFPRVEWT